jgi:hypothetical protein
MFDIDNSAKKPKTNTNRFIIKVNKTDTENKPIRPKKLEQSIQNVEPANEEASKSLFIIY